jgi:hypothetical protein
MSEKIWTIHNDRRSPPVGNDLNGVHIQKVDGGYLLQRPNMSLPPLSTTNATEPPLNCDHVHYQEGVWNIEVYSLPAHRSDPGGRGRWGIPVTGTGPGGDPTDGDITVQAGSGLGEGADDAASSASA